MNHDDKVELIDFNQALSERYLSYALSTIMSRSLPDVRDGLKPVHRRLLYAMLKLHLDPSSGYKKCARVVGDVIGKYHPHGDTAVYDTLVRLAQDFSLRYPLIDGQGNFGSIDGDNAAAMRYTESRLTQICTFLMHDIDQDTIDFRPTYDDTELEPVIFPASFPNLLANGCEGIAVGMAISIPPHNLHELCDATIHMIDNPNSSIADILSFVKGPDLPTGGIITDSQAVIAKAYETGRGSFRVRARWKKENLSHGTYQIIVYEIPYQVQKSKLIEQIASLLKDKRLPLVTNIRDESAEEVRIVIEPRSRDCSPEIVMESLFKLTELETRINLNMNVIGSNNVPKVMNLLEILQEFLSHRKVVVTRRSLFQINKIENRLEVLQGFQIAYLNLDDVIRIIRTTDEPKQELIATFNLSDVQSEAILNMRLRSLHKLDELAIIKEIKELKSKHAVLSSIINDEKQLWKVVKEEILTIQTKFGFSSDIGRRRTTFNEIEHQAQVVDISAFIEKEPVTVICSEMGWIRCIKGHNQDLSSLKYKEGDKERFIIEAYTTDKILLCSSLGRFFTILVDNLQKGKGQSQPLSLVIDIADEDIVSIITYKPNQKILLASNNSKGFIVSSDDLTGQTKLGKQVMQVSIPNSVIACLPLCGDVVACIGSNRKLLIFNIEEIPEMKKGQGVILQRFKDAYLSDITILDSKNPSTWNFGKKVKLEEDLFTWMGKRGGVGKIPPHGFSKDNKFARNNS